MCDEMHPAQDTSAWLILLGRSESQLYRGVPVGKSFSSSGEIRGASIGWLRNGLSEGPLMNYRETQNIRISSPDRSTVKQKFSFRVNHLSSSTTDVKCMCELSINPSTAVWNPRIKTSEKFEFNACSYSQHAEYAGGRGQNKRGALNFQILNKRGVLIKSVF